MGRIEKAWIEPDIRDDVVNFITIITKKTEIKVNILLKLIDIDSSKYYSWRNREGLPNFHNGKIPKQNWLLPWEKDSIISYAKKHLGEGYRRLTYMMMDEDV
ncbi:MAG TPA: IS3 family transposase, partial [Ignavibacteria bacterium]|nr:IS3 family transposase [Ignavibacteria bacterium]HMR41434.1 IS3 family transposase [Ignavibacteria bacterium]